MEETKFMEKMIVDHMHDFTTRRLPRTDPGDCCCCCCDDDESFNNIDVEAELFMNEYDEDEDRPDARVNNAEG